MIYITSRRFTERTNAVTDVKIYANAAAVELRVNGESQGTRQNDGNGVILWREVRLTPGKNQIEATAQAGAKLLTDTCVWQLSNP